MKQKTLDKLATLGFDSYHDYLQSKHWDDVKRMWRSSSRPHFCITCNGPAYELHHQTYENLGCEPLADLAPLCRTCHEHIHRCFPEREAVRLDKGLMMHVFAWSETEAVRRLGQILISAKLKKKTRVRTGKMKVGRIARDGGRGQN